MCVCKRGYQGSKSRSHTGSHHLAPPYQVDDGWPLRLWKGSVEVDASQKEALQRVLREHGHWEKTLKQSAVVQTLTKDTEVYRYLLQGLGSRPPQEHLLLR